MTPVRISAPSALCHSREGRRSAGGIHVVGRDGGGCRLRILEAPSNPRDHQRSSRDATSQPNQLHSYHANTAEKPNSVKTELTFINEGCNHPASKAKLGFLISPAVQEASRDWVMHWRHVVVTAEMSGSRWKFVSIVHFVSQSEDKYSNWVKLKELKNLHSVHLCPLPHTAAPYSHTFQKWAPFFF